MYIQSLLKKRQRFTFVEKYLFINIYFVPFKIIPLKYNILMQALFPILEAFLIQTF